MLILSEFSRQNWQQGDAIAIEAVRLLRDTDGIPDSRRLPIIIPRVFLTLNNIVRSDVEETLVRVLHGCRISTTISPVAVQGDGTTIVMKGDYIVKKDIKIDNTGQMATNIDSTNSSVSVDRQQQVVSAEQERALRLFVDRTEVQDALALPIAPEEKTSIVGSRLAKLAGVGLDVATSFAAKVVAETVKN